MNINDLARPGMIFAVLSVGATRTFANKTLGEIGMGRHGTVTSLRQQAMEALHKSTTMLDVASSLLKQGNREEAKRLQEEARAKRSESIWLMAKANTIEMTSRHQRHYRASTSPH